LKPIYGEKKKEKGPTAESQIDEILRVMKAVAHRLGAGEGLATPGEMATMEQAAKASVERRREKDRVLTLDKDQRKNLLLKAKELVKNRHK